MQKNKNREDEVKKKDLPATPSSTLPWSAKRPEEITVYEIRMSAALPVCDYVMIGNKGAQNNLPELRETSIMHGCHNKDSWAVRSVDNNFITF